MCQTFTCRCLSRSTQMSDLLVICGMLDLFLVLLALCKLTLPYKHSSCRATQKASHRYAKNLSLVLAMGRTPTLRFCNATRRLEMTSMADASPPRTFLCNNRKGEIQQKPLKIKQARKLKSIHVHSNGATAPSQNLFQHFSQSSESFDGTQCPAPEPNDN